MHVGPSIRLLSFGWARGPLLRMHRGDANGAQISSAGKCFCNTAAGLCKKYPQPRPLLTPVEFAQIAPMVLLCQALKQHAAMDSAVGINGNSAVISRAIFNHYCFESHVENSDEALRLLEESGSVVSLSNGEGVHLRPLQFAHMYEDLTGEGEEKGSSSAFFLEEATRRLEAAEAEEAAMRSELQPALLRAAKWRRVVWGGALCFSGAQLAIISRLTFFDFDWDTMEPVSYFLGTGTSLLFFLYFLRHGRSHTYEDYDRTMLPPKLRKYAPPGFDWEKYEAICKKVDEERKMLNRIKEWMKKH
ncbi:hypothetical protein MOQ_004121 [Trypanosoma cruzi marinkellei]|uniref:Calcium uniporter protein C-terminal domain-containing protein n=1 Tax=Trypanosoma cruzi marinkellei TaxID=85056 RepID=K2NAY8_TRYCR|nr:hypothetical protein MOQ_004121 [Trypanosoma cruzi marinkellei]